MLTPADLQELESSLLPALERHHLRLLAHSLGCLQQAAALEAEAAAATHRSGCLPSAEALNRWAAVQPTLQADPEFAPVLLEQLGKAALQLEAIAAEQGAQPMELTIAALVAWGRRQADARLADAAGLSPPPDPPPG